MKKINKLILLLVVLSIGLVGCKNTKNNNESLNNTATSENKNEKIKVYASIYPLYDFAKNIGKDKIDLNLLIPNGQEPHDFEPDNSDIKNLESADVFIYNGAGLESWSEKTIKSLNNKNLLSIVASDGVNISKEDSEGIDPHVWLDPKNAIIESENIKNVFIKADPENEEFYTNNFNEYKEKLQKLDSESSEKLKNIKDNKIVVSHSAYGYLTKAYNLEQIGIEGVNAEAEPDAKTMSEIVDFVKKNNIKVIFAEDIIDPKVADTIAKEARIKTEFLNPLESLTEEEVKNNEDYISIMTSNINKIYEALK